MIRYIKLKNYKSLVDFSVDFMKTKSNAKNIVLIYGENGVGKSNLATAFYTLTETIGTMSSIELWKKYLDDRESASEDEEVKSIFEDYLKDNFKDTERIIKDSKTIGSKENMVMEFGFRTDGKDGVYRIEMNDDEIVSERLDFVLNKNQTNFFELSKENMYINPQIVNDKKYYNELKELLNQYWGKHSFFAIISYEINDKKKGYVKSKISNNFFLTLSYFETLCTKVKIGSKLEHGTLRLKHHILSQLSKGKVPTEEEKELDKVEEFINYFFTSMYSDIKRVYYEKEIKGDSIKYKLMVSKMIYGEIRDIEFKRESTGTINLLDLLPFLIAACEGQDVIIDELDTGIHDILVYKILENISQYITGQLIITTHNTLLMDSEIPKEDIYVFNVNKFAEKELIPINEFNGRIHKNINPQKKFLSGMYGGIPFVSDIDFDEMIEKLK